jgi:alpha-tubulin suppressor-like RCC1 family protein
MKISKGLALALLMLLPYLSYADSPFVIFAGDVHSCAIQEDNTVICWGANPSGQKNAPDEKFLQISNYHHTTCGILKNNSLTCWGYNRYGEANSPGGSYSQVSTGYYHSCAIKDDESIKCWGNNGSGRATPPKGKFSQLSSGYDHNCALKTDGKVVCWGLNISGESNAPKGIFTQITVGNYYSCGLRTDKTVACWGKNNYGQTNPEYEAKFSQISAGYNHACGVKIDGAIDCWGYNNYSQASTPSGQFTTVTAGNQHSCAVKLDNTVHCWGFNTDGRATPSDITVLKPEDTTPPEECEEDPSKCPPVDPPLELEELAFYDTDTKILTLSAILIAFVDDFTLEETDEKAIFEAELENKGKLRFELLPWSLKLVKMYNNKDTTKYIRYKSKTNELEIPCLKVARKVNLGGGTVTGKIVLYKDIILEQRHIKYPIFEITERTETKSCSDTEETEEE